MSATLLTFRPLSRRRYQPSILFGAYTPPRGSRVAVNDCGGAFDVEVIEHEGQDGFAVIATCGDPDDAAHHARCFAKAHGLETMP